MINRRDLIGSAGIFASALSANSKRAKQIASFEAADLEADTFKYAEFGNHQTGSPGDKATCKWLEERLTMMGFTTVLQPIEVPFFEPTTVGIVSDGLSLQGIAQHPVTLTPGQPIKGRLVERRTASDDAALKDNIAVISLPYGRHSSSATVQITESLQAAKTAGAIGSIIISDGPTRSAIALNAKIDAPFRGMPIVVVGSSFSNAIHDLINRSVSVGLTVTGAVGIRTGHNIIARRNGIGKTFVLTTPLSGWFRCAGERGTGIATWLALAEWLATAYPSLPLTVAGFVGHEFENYGSKNFFDQGAPKPEDVKLWLHLGSGFATRDWHEAGPAGLLPLPSADPQRFLIAAPQFLPVLKKTFKGVLGFEAPYEATVERAAGEAKSILDSGYHNLIANFGGHRFHHTESDGPETTCGKLTAQAANALRSALSQILG